MLRLSRGAKSSQDAPPDAAKTRREPPQARPFKRPIKAFLCDSLYSAPYYLLSTPLEQLLTACALHAARSSLSHFNADWGCFLCAVPAEIEFGMQNDIFLGQEHQTHNSRVHGRGCTAGNLRSPQGNWFPQALSLAGSLLPVSPRFFVGAAEALPGSSGRPGIPHHRPGTN